MKVPKELVVQGALDIFNEMIANMPPEKQWKARLEFNALIIAELESRKRSPK